MERKRKLPARAASRLEQASKRRQSTPREPSEEPAPSPPGEEPPSPPPPPPPLPQSVQAGQPLPTVEHAQPQDLPITYYQSIGESGVLTESLARSRHQWIHEGLFQKYWTKPHKRKGVLHEDPKNPPKDSMSKVGSVTITMEPHIIEATMFVVKGPKPRAQQQQQQPKPSAQAQPRPLDRPIIQYGPPNGSMPPPATPGASASIPPSPAPSVPPSESARASPAPSPGQTQRAPSSESENKPSHTPQPAATPAQAVQPAQQPAQPQRATPTPSPAPSYPPRPPPPAPVSSVAQTPPPPGSSAGASSSAARPPPSPRPGQAAGPGANPAHNQPGPSKPAPAPPPGSTKPGTSGPAPQAKAATNDPVIALLAQRASGDPELRDLMKRVAVGQAKQEELNHFQSIINQLNAEYKRGGGQQGPSADRLLVDGRTVRYFADEVCAILDIVLASNPNQRAADLRPPPRSDALVVLLVKTALEDERTKAMCKRIATGKPGFTDATDLKDILDRLHRDSKTTPQSTKQPAPQARQPTPVQATNGQANGNPHAPPLATHGHTQPNHQALRSKGPPPAPKPEISAVVFDFGTGDRYLFPKYSILEYLPARGGQQVLASFLIVRKGSTAEYGGDPELDYYQPVTMRLSTSTGRHLENLTRVVAPRDEVRRYMDDVMDNMTRAEYILLAMRLPRAPPKEEAEPTSGNGSDDTRRAGSTPQAEKILPEPAAAPSKKPPVLWTKSAATAKTVDLSRSISSREAEEETQAQYRRLISSVAAKESAAT